MRFGKHIAVIGAGVIGLATAVRLRREGYRVTLIDPEEPGSQTSFGNAGLIMTAQNGPLSSPGIWRKVPGMLSDRDGPLVVRWRNFPGLTPWFLRFLGNSRWSRYEAIANTLTPLVTRSLESWQTLVGPYESSRLFRQDGLLYVYRNRKNFRAAQKELEFRHRYGIPGEVIPTEELRQMEPALAPDLAGGVLYPESGHCTDPATLSAALFSAYRQAGGEVRRSEVKDLQPSSAGVRIVTPEGETVVDEVVVAAGIWSPKLVKPFGVRPMLAAERGYHLMLTKPDITLRRPVAAGDDKFVITPMAKGIRLAGTAEFASVKTPPDYRRSDILLGLAQRLLPEIDGQATATRWMGARPSTPDSLPVIGRTPKNRRIICAFGHAHLGLTLGAVTAEMVSDLVGGRVRGFEALRPERF
jgi:glycine/D-amino acid oxidase-like deaminating enzyme